MSGWVGVFVWVGAATASAMGAYQKEALAEYRIRLLNGAWVGGCEWVGGRVCLSAATASVMGAYQKEALAEYRIWLGGCR